MTSALVPGTPIGQVRKTAAKIVTLPHQAPVDAPWFATRTQSLVDQARRVWSIDGWTIDRSDFRQNDYER